MKDLKKNYRYNYDKLKNLKVEVDDNQANIDGMKQQNFENWYQQNCNKLYLEEFEPGGKGAQLQHMDDSNTGKINAKTGGMMSTYKGDSLLGGEDIDDDAFIIQITNNNNQIINLKQLAFIRAKRKVDTLHKAKKLEKAMIKMILM